MVEATPLKEFRHVARSYRVGLFKREIVLVLSSGYTCTANTLAPILRAAVA